MNFNERKIVPLRILLLLCSLTMALGAVYRVVVLSGALLTLHGVASGVLYPIVAILLGWWAFALHPTIDREKIKEPAANA